jgi:hypothetical protein
VNDIELLAVITSHRRDSLGCDSSELSQQRADALDHYHGRPYGNEIDGRSQVVSKDLSEAVDWMMPGVLNVFMMSGNIAEFDPQNQDDEKLAQQESDVINKVFMQDNNGFMVLHDAIKDALLLKNGYIKHMWEESEESQTTSYTGLTIQDVEQLLQYDGGEVEILGQEEKTVYIETPMGQQPVQVFDIKLKCTKKVGKVICVPVPPEELRISRRCRGPLAESPFVEHVTRKTRSDLIQLGMKKSFVDTLAAYNENENDSEKLARDSVSDESDSDGSSFSDRSMDEIEYCEAYLKADYDGDGIAELRKVVTVSNRIPPGEDWNEEIDAMPITGGVPKRIPHRHVGESLDDDIADLQEIKTTLLRQMLDNIYATNNNQWLVNERVNLADFMQSLPGGIKRVRGMEPIANSVEAVQTTPIMQQIMPAIDYIDSTKESRTGINRATTGLDPDVLKQSTKGAFMENLNRASQKQEMITRMLAETLVKPTLLAVHALMIKHQDKPMVTRLRGEFVQINPQEWKHRSDITLRVGLGTGNEEEKRNKLMMVASLQKEIAALGLVGPEQGYALFSDMMEAMGFDMPEKYAMSPDSPEFKQKMANPPKNPDIQLKEMELQADAQKFQAESQLKQQEKQMDAQLEAQQSEANMQQELARSQNDIIIEREKVSAQMELERYKAQLQAETQIRLKEMDIAAQLQLEAMRPKPQPHQHQPGA